MLLAQEIQHAADHSEFLTLALAVIAIGWQAFRETLNFLAKQGRGVEQSPGELGRRIDRLERGERDVLEELRGVRESVVAANTMLNQPKPKR
tara:strand:- start:844 stop:1119 length:276 start_codon:yes stop_codon:yes gene_type:complete